MRARSTIALLFALLALASPALAQFPPPPDEPMLPLPRELSPSIQAFGDIDKTCFEWTDQCRTCRRADNDAVTCPNIGMACTPQPIVCLSRSPMGLPLPPAPEAPKPAPIEVPNMEPKNLEPKNLEPKK
jgi:hypothetical protein